MAEDYDVSEIFGIPEILGKVIEKSYVRLEFTLCHPHTKMWQRTTVANKMALYGSFLRSARAYFAVHIIDDEIQFEDTDGEHLHAHGYIDLAIGLPVYPSGLCSDLCSLWLELLPKRYNHPYEGNPYDNYDCYFQRIRLPQCCIQYRSADNKHRIEYWNNYIRKGLEYFD